MTVALIPRRRHLPRLRPKALLGHLGASILILILLILATLFGPIFYVVVTALVGLTLWKRYYFQTFIAIFGLPLVTVALAVVTYCFGSAKLLYMGLPHMEFYNVDPEYRCGNETGGCLPNGNEWITDSPNNLTVQALISIFGPQRGSYTGPYPTESDATTALASTVPVDLSAVTTDQFDVGQVHVRLDSGVGKKFVKYWLRGQTVEDFRELIKMGVIGQNDGAGSPTAAIWKNRVLLLKGPSLRPTICAIDLTKGRPFAYYQNAEQVDRFPPVMWRKSDDFP